jgi:chromosome segregation ATPase
MYRLVFLLLLVIQYCPPAFPQESSPDSPTLQTVLKEIRQLRQDFKTASIAIERTQILIHRLHEQDIAVGRALQRLDDARSKLGTAQASRLNLVNRIKSMEDQQSGINNPQESKETADIVSQLKAKLAVSLTEEQEAQRRVTECEEQMQAEQAKSSALQDQLDQVDRALHNPAGR